MLSLETFMERAGSVHCHIPDDLHGVQVLPLLGQSAAIGETDQMVQTPVNR